jgi:hypothetical protein
MCQLAFFLLPGNYNGGVSVTFGGYNGRLQFLLSDGGHRSIVPEKRPFWTPIRAHNRTKTT